MKKITLLVTPLLAIPLIIGCGNSKTQVDKIIKNANIYTANKEKLHAEALAIKDGKFVYVGNNNGVSNYEGTTIDLENKFLMPAIIDGHAHIALSVATLLSPSRTMIEAEGKSNILNFIKETIEKDNPKQDWYKFALPLHKLNGEKLNKNDIDSVSFGTKVTITEIEGHSLWANSKMLEACGINDNTPDLVPNLSYYERDENGKITGYCVEMCATEISMKHTESITETQIKDSLVDFFDYTKQYGVSTYFDAGTPGNEQFHERAYKVLCDLDNEGKLPINVEGCYIAYTNAMLDRAVTKLKEYKAAYNTKHVKVNTLKVMSDGTLDIHTAALVKPYADKPGEFGTSLYDTYDLAKLLKELNKEGFNFHAHTVGERAVMQVLDAVEKVKKEIGDEFKIDVTCAHIEIAREQDLKRFGELGVHADFTPWWSGGGAGGNGIESVRELLGEERVDQKYRSKTTIDGGALVGYSSDNIQFGDFMLWNPYLGMEIGMTRRASKQTRLPDYEQIDIDFPSDKERLSIDEVLQGYTSINAKILNLSNKGSIEINKDADYLIFDQDLIKANKTGFSYIVPSEVYFEGKQVYTKTSN